MSPGRDLYNELTHSPCSRNLSQLVINLDAGKYNGIQLVVFRSPASYNCVTIEEFSVIAPPGRSIILKRPVLPPLVISRDVPAIGRVGGNGCPVATSSFCRGNNCFRQCLIGRGKARDLVFP